MDKGIYKCKLEHSHLCKSDKDKCNTAYKLSNLNKKQRQKKQTLLVKPIDKNDDEIQMKQDKRSYRQNVDSQCDDDETYTFNVNNSTFVMGINQMLANFDILSAKRSADKFIREIRENMVDQQYLIYTDNDNEQWAPSKISKWNNWQSSVKDDNQKQLTIKKCHKPKQNYKMQYIRRRIHRHRKSKQELGIIFQCNSALANFYEDEYLLQLLPTQIPSINLRHRNFLKEKYRKLQTALFSIYLERQEKKLNPNDPFDIVPRKFRQIRQRLFRLTDDIDILCGILDHNIFNHRLPWNFHYQEARVPIQNQIVDLWIVLKDLPKNKMPESKQYLKPQILKYFSEWMGVNLQKYNYQYCVSVGIIQDEQAQEKKSQQTMSQSKKAQIDPDVKQIKLPRNKIDKYYKNWDEIAHQLGQEFRSKQNKLQNQSFSTTCMSQSISKSQSRIIQQRTWTDTKKLIQEQKDRRYFALNSQKTFYTRCYFRKSHQIFYLNPIKQIRLYEQSYDLLQGLDPICQCGQVMNVTSLVSYIDFWCKCGHVWEKKFNKLRKCKQFGVVFELQGKKKTEAYQSIKSIEKRNNFHQFLYTWMRRARYSDQVPFKLKTNIPVFSQSTNLSIEYNREEQNYLPLQICDSLIPSAGKGLKTTQNIKKDCLILTYTGIIKAHYEVQAKNNSIFSLGIINTTDNIALLIDPLEYGNAAKYINTAEKKYVNCRAQLGIFKPRDLDPPEPAILIIAIKDIKKNTELFYEYGKTYGNFVPEKANKSK